jgi:GNAT superfamily N-acetyltransferase
MRYLPDLVTMWRESFEGGVGVVDTHPLGEQQQYFLREVLPRNEVRLALLDAKLVGFVAASADSVAQLYVRVGFQRRGIGSMLLDWAKRRSSGTLSLFTFAQNQGACAFYVHHGFVAVAHGFEPMWQLADVKYEWRATGVQRT